MTLKSHVLRIEDYFRGKTRAHGLVEDRFGRVRRRFVADISGYPSGDDFVLEETFAFTDGEVSKRIWRVRSTDVAGYEGTAADVIGVARGRADGDSLKWAYDLRLSIGGRKIVVGFDDRMYLGDDGVMINIARMHKWGLTIGRITIAFTRCASSGEPSTASRV
ncbi:MAG: DUF3833 family protein [Alphaproteobacteria bacterium]